MYREKLRFKQDPATVIRSKPATFNAPLKWKDQARVFVCSWSDFFIEDADEWREEAWEIMRQTPHLTYQILTKRPENIAGRLPAAYECFGGGWPLHNVWLGVTVENQVMADLRIHRLLQTPASKRFISIEPMVGNVDLERVLWPMCINKHRVDVLRGGYWNREGVLAFGNSCDLEEEKGGYTNHSDFPATLDWVIVGGETGPKARMMQPEWAESLLNQCKETETPFFMKQMSKKAAIPENLMVRQFPE